MDSRRSYRGPTEALAALAAAWLWLAATPACTAEDGRSPDEGEARSEVGRKAGREARDDARPDARPDAKIDPRPRAAAAARYTLFEAGQVRPLALSPDGKHLFAVNTPDDRIEVFEVRPTGLVHQTSIPVGLEPVAIAARTDRELWVVNHLSDSVSVIELDRGGRDGRVVRTLLVGDEPRDLVFAGPHHDRAFITTAHRGQNAPFDPQLTTPGVGRHDVWVFDAGHLGESLGGDPIAILSLFSDTPRALAVTPDGSRVYSAAFQSGNRTTAINHKILLGPGEVFPQLAPTTNFEGIPQPVTGLIAKFDGAHWRRRERAGVGRPGQAVSLPDKDVFVIDAMADPPAPLRRLRRVLRRRRDHPVQHDREPGRPARSTSRTPRRATTRGSRARGRSRAGRCGATRSRAGSPCSDPAGTSPRGTSTSTSTTTSAAARCPTPRTPRAWRSRSEWRSPATARRCTWRRSARARSASTSTAELEADTFVPEHGEPDPRDRRRADRARARRARPPALRADPVRQRDLDRRHPEPQRDRPTSRCTAPSRPASSTGRRFLYDAALELEPRRHVVRELPRVRRLRQPRLGPRQPGRAGDPRSRGRSCSRPAVFDPNFNPDFQPMKGPMTTQSLRGLANHGPMHWRGDRTGANDAPSAQPDSGSFDERAAFLKFRVGFTSLLGRAADYPRGRSRGVRRLHPPAHLSAQPDPEARQLAHARPAGRPRLLRRSAHRRLHQRLRGLPRARSQRQPGRRRARLLRHRGRSRVRAGHPGVQGPAPAQRLPEGGDVRHGGVELHQHRRQRLQGRSGPRLRLPARRLGGHRVPVHRHERVQ